VKAAAFAYERPKDVKQAMDLLADPDAKPLAGGQSLIPMMAMRLARPRTLVDVAVLEELRQVEWGDDSVEIGAAVTQRRLERSPEVRERVPFLAAVIPFVGHREIRNRGTVGGTIAHADPGGEVPTAAALLDASLTVRGASGTRTLRGREFFTGPYQSQLGPGDLLTSIRFPTARAGDGFAFEEVARRHGDYALCGVGVHVRRRGDGVELARIGLLGLGQAPLVLDAEEQLGDAGGDPERLRSVAERLAEPLQPSGDMHGSSEYRRRLARVLIARCLERAWHDAGERAA
jgi:carbon-monoxide dehydrogenase medium subunit